VGNRIVINPKNLWRKCGKPNGDNSAKTYGGNAGNPITINPPKLMEEIGETR